ncbi:MAG: GNAT family N-acetyltransferase [Candidatus Thorarchaeota archaeon]
MYILPRERYKEIIHLFDKSRFISSFRSHLELISVSKEVFVDDIENPQSALVMVNQMGFLGGKANNNTFNKALFDYFFIEKKEEFIDLYNGSFFFYVESDDWINALYKVVPYPFAEDRYYYEIEELANKNWREMIPEGYTIEPINYTLLDRNYLKNYDWIMGVIEEAWSPFEERLKEIRGFYLLKGNEEIVSWCTTEYLTLENDIEVNIATREEYQRKGFGLIVGSATAEYCLAKYKTVGWHCAKRNIGSIKTAEKIGFKRKFEYRNIGFTLNTIDNLIINGDIYSEKGMFEEAINYYEILLDFYDQDLDDFSSSNYFTKDNLSIDKILFQTAKCFAAMGKEKETIQFLEKAANQGFKNLKAYEEDKYLLSFQIKKERDQIREKIIENLSKE